MSQTFEDKALYRIRGTGGGWAFSPRDFLDLGGRPTVDSGLHRLEKRGEIRRVIRGIYDYPRFSKLLDQNLSPDIDQVARALARKFRWRIQPSGATALNFLGLSTQVPARAVYLSDGPDRLYQIGNTALAFEHIPMAPLRPCEGECRWLCADGAGEMAVRADRQAGGYSRVC